MQPQDFLSRSLKIREQVKRAVKHRKHGGEGLRSRGGTEQGNRRRSEKRTEYIFNNWADSKASSLACPKAFMPSLTLTKGDWVQPMPCASNDKEIDEAVRGTLCVC